MRNVILDCINIVLDCIIIIDGDLSQDDISVIKESSGIKIAADGAANKLMRNEIVPDYIIGDFDSLGSIDSTKAQLIKVPSQEKYDFEKCLDFAFSNGFKNILVIGMNGGLLDHTLNNWSIFVKYSLRIAKDSLKINLHCYAKKQIGTLITEDISFNTNNDIISIIPSPTAILTTEGLMWNLDNQTLEFGKTEGARNKAVNDKVIIKLHSGKYILFI